MLCAAAAQRQKRKRGRAAAGAAAPARPCSHARRCGVPSGSSLRHPGPFRAATRATSVRSVCGTSTRRRTSSTARPSTSRSCGLSFRLRCAAAPPQRARGVLRRLGAGLGTLWLTGQQQPGREAVRNGSGRDAAAIDRGGRLSCREGGRRGTRQGRRQQRKPTAVLEAWPAERRVGPHMAMRANRGGARVTSCAGGPGQGREASLRSSSYAHGRMRPRSLKSPAVGWAAWQLWRPHSPRRPTALALASHDLFSLTCCVSVSACRVAGARGCHRRERAGD